LKKSPNYLDGVQIQKIADIALEKVAKSFAGEKSSLVLNILAAISDYPDYVFHYD
jgi:hypothetical protein